ncbi:PKD domain-containing protein [Adhaeribacter sp. BT258]|uniref:PKD domain-containing protein n=1 Tax=Adhaeribacter terrigena TaxID=2793070 RepID=A0ABS1C0X0_9BACT|nr:GEVED domain-containing protein [Adhaeribacter terrigena]MBK0403051.1 PKD domain-containing protein [Adhaeribacter terrigena]
MIRFLVGLFILLAYYPFYSKAQCPVANSCTPGNAPASSFPFGMGIYNVTIGSGTTGISYPTTGGAPAGYQDYSCTQKATILEGVSTTISVTTNPNLNENVKVWLDMNNNGIFDNTTELIFSSVNAKVHIGSFTIPVSASVIKNTLLRLRVSADNFSSLLPTPCSTPQYSQVEDYGITVLPNTNKPAVAFSVNNPVTCSPTVQFQNQTQNGATSYFWYFGDGSTSSLANPIHTYATTGTYTIKLKVCNANGCDSLTRNNYINYHTNVPVAASCSPITTNYCCGYGITNFNFGNGLMTNASADGSVGYENFSCTKSVTVQESNTYSVSITNGSNNSQDSWIYIDYNNDGSFSTNELVFTKLGTVNPSGFIVIQNNGLKNIPLRMRVITDSQGSPNGPCANRTNGQVEDYTIIILPNTNKPITIFSTNFNTLCDTLVQFTDQSQNAPTSWQWEFGDGSIINTQQNPLHLYTATGAYTVKLISCNVNGCDTLIKKQNIYIRKPCPQYCIPNWNSSGAAILNVSFNSLNNNSSVEPNAYGDYTNLSTAVILGSTYSFSSTTNHFNSQIYAWIDFNQDGDFDDYRELICYGTGITNLTRNIQIPNNAKPGPTRMRVAARPVGGVIVPCVDFTSVEMEDYTINIVPNNQPPTALFSTYNQTVCSNTVLFSDSSANAPLTWYWNFGDPASGSSNNSTLEHPTHNFSSPGKYAVSLKVCNEFGCDSIVKIDYITILSSQGPRSIACRPGTYDRTPRNKQGIYSFALNTINYSSPAGNGYEDYSCSQQTTLMQGTSYPVTINTGPFQNSNVKMWIDFNNDGALNSVTELAFTSSMMKVHTGSFTVPMNTVLNTPLRLRVSSDAIGPCDASVFGQVEDYAVIIVPNAGKPIASFSPSSYSSCNPQLTFTDQSVGIATTWSWDFGDNASGGANSSSLQNPTHTFSGPGNYAVMLTACNAAGCHSVKRIVSIIAPPNAQAGCVSTSPSNIFGEGILNVQFLNVNQSSGNSSEGYKDFTCAANAVTTPGSFLLNVQTNPNRFETMEAFIDFNNDGNFSGTVEEVASTFNKGLHSAIIVVPRTAVRNTWLRFRIVDLDQDFSHPSPCGSARAGQAEDYAIMIQDKIEMITNVVGIKDDKTDLVKKVNVYPNPSNGTFSIEIPTVLKGSCQLEIQNMVGQVLATKMYSGNGGLIPMDLKYLPKGMYLLKINNEEIGVIKKILIE